MSLNEHGDSSFFFVYWKHVFSLLQDLTTFFVFLARNISDGLL